MCKGLLKEILNLGNLRLNAFPKAAWEIATIPEVPLILTVCPDCGLVQLDRTVPPDWMYREYWYRSGVNETMITELEEIVYAAGKLVDLAPSDWVLDIGANDGTLLSHYKKIYTSRCPLRAAIEPALNLRASLEVHCDRLIQDYFPSALLDGQYKIITAIACAYDTEDPVAFFQGIKDRLAPTGVAIIQFQDFSQQLEASAFDNVCHEHLLYYSLWSLSNILLRVGLRTWHVTQTPINGGSLRVVVRHQHIYGRSSSDPSVGYQLAREMTQHLDITTIRDGDLSAFTRFAARVTAAKRQITATLQQGLDAGAVIDVYGASTKGNILLQVLGLGPNEIRQAIDRSPEKDGCLTITGIPIVGEEEARREPADLWLCPIWGFRASVLAREQWYLEQGGSIIFPLPYVDIVRQHWGPVTAERES